MKYLIIGNGVSSIGAIEGIRKLDQESEILVISEEEFPTYGRPLISYYLAGKIGDDRVWLRKKDFYSKNKVTLKLQQKVTALKLAEKRVVLQGGEEERI